jgi:hypothetical protein
VAPPHHLFPSFSCGMRRRPSFFPFVHRGKCCAQGRVHTLSTREWTRKRTTVASEGGEDFGGGGGASTCRAHRSRLSLPLVALKPSLSFLPLTLIGERAPEREELRSERERPSRGNVVVDDDAFVSGSSDRWDRGGGAGLNRPARPRKRRRSIRYVKYACVLPPHSPIIGSGIKCFYKTKTNILLSFEME